MSIKVCKFGGSSVCDGDRFAQVSRILHSDPDRRYIVLSAPGKRFPGDDKVTDLLYRAWDADDDTAQFIFTRIYLRYASIRDQCAPEFDLESEFSRIRRCFRTSRDYAASRGEYLCARLFAAAFDLPFVDAAELFFFHESGAIDLPATCRSIKERLSSLDRAVIPGFYGSLPGGCIRTFSRGGSDVSGALIASALHADLYENWTDVDGLYTADPNLVPDARRNRCVSLHQMEQLARAGAQVLHPDALRPLEGTGVDALLKNTSAPDALGTRISERCTEPVPCVTGQRKLYCTAAPDAPDRCPLLHAVPFDGGVEVAAVRIFGARETQQRRIAAELHPLHIIHMQDHMEIIVPNDTYCDAIRKVHGILMEDAVEES